MVSLEREMKIIFDPVNCGVIAVQSRIADNCTTTIKIGENMADLFKDFQDWLAYNHPEVKLEPLQEDLVKIALRHHSNKVTKTARRAILKELTQHVMFAETKEK